MVSQLGCVACKLGVVVVGDFQSLPSHKSKHFQLMWVWF